MLPTEHLTDSFWAPKLCLAGNVGPYPAQPGFSSRDLIRTVCYQARRTMPALTRSH
jgi:hypothetical protein